MNNKGFMMAEVVVVASIVLVAMAGLYASYNKIFSIYNQRINYYDVSTLYELSNYRKYDLSGDVSSVPKVNLGGKIIYYVSIDTVKNNTLDVTNQTFKDYLTYLSANLDFDKLDEDGISKLLLMEKCIDIDDCKYAYLEVFENEATT